MLTAFMYSSYVQIAEDDKTTGLVLEIKTQRFTVD